MYETENELVVIRQGVNEDLFVVVVEIRQGVQTVKSSRLDLYSRLEGNRVHEGEHD